MYVTSLLHIPSESEKHPVLEEIVLLEYKNNNIRIGPLRYSNLPPHCNVPFLPVKMDHSLYVF